MLICCLRDHERKSFETTLCILNVTLGPMACVTVQGVPKKMKTTLNNYSSALNIYIYIYMSINDTLLDR